jgi:hypothetical protein
MSNSLYIVRNGSSRNFDIFRIIISVLSFGLCFINVKKRREYLAVWVVSFIFWSVTEIILAKRKIREGEIVNEDQMYLAGILRGSAEGSAITLACLTVSDTLLCQNSKLSGFLGFLIGASFWVYTIAVRQEFKNIDTKTSRRDLFKPLSLIILSIFTVTTLVYFVYYPVDRKRVFSLFLVLTLWGFIWNLTAVITNVRWIENSSQEIQDPWQTTLGISFDSIVEIGFAYTFFLCVVLLIKHKLF